MTFYAKLVIKNNKNHLENDKWLFVGFSHQIDCKSFCIKWAYL